MLPVVAWKISGSRSIASSRLRGYLPVKKLRANTWPVEVFKQSHIKNYKVVIFQKAYTNEDIALAKTLKENDVVIILDQCDNHFCYESSNTTLEERAGRLRIMTGLADIVIASTPKIAELFKSKKTFVIDDFLEDYRLNWFKSLFFKIKLSFMLPNKNNYVQLIWFGGAGTKTYPSFGLCDLVACIPELNKLGQQHNIMLTVCSNFREEYDHEIVPAAKFPTRFYTWNEKTYRYLLAGHDICLLPININPFTVCKTNNRLVLALLLGLEVVADIIPSYQELSEYFYAGVNAESISRCITDKDKAIGSAVDARNYILKHYGDSAILPKWEALLSHLGIKPAKQAD
jgi:hypothetical protein